MLVPGEDRDSANPTPNPHHIMARKTVRVDIPSNSPDDFIKLGRDIHAKHVADGASSPLNTDKMLALKAALDLAEPKNVQAKQLDAQAQTLRQARDTSMGTADGQNAQTPGTGLNLVSNARDQLLLTFEGNEESLSQWGFNVVIGTAKSPTKPPPTP